MKTIAELRRERGWTQKQLADRLNLSGQSVYYWERGQKLPNVLTLRAIARVFGVSMDDIDFETPYEQYWRKNSPGAEPKPDAGCGTDQLIP